MQGLDGVVAVVPNTCRATGLAVQRRVMTLGRGRRGGCGVGRSCSLIVVVLAL